MAATLCDVLCEALEIQEPAQASHPYSALYHTIVKDPQALAYMRKLERNGWDVLYAEKLLQRAREIRHGLLVNKSHEDGGKITVREYVKRQLGTQLLALLPSKQRRMLDGYCAKLLKDGVVKRQRNMFGRSKYYIEKDDQAARHAIDEALATYGKPGEQKRDFFHLLQEAVQDQLGLTGPRRDVRVTNLYYVLRDDERLRPYLSKQSNKLVVRPAAESLLADLIKQGSSYASFMPTPAMRPAPPLAWSALPDDYLAACRDTIMKRGRLEHGQEQQLFSQLSTSRSAFVSGVLRHPINAAALGRTIAMLLDDCSSLSDWSALFHGTWAQLTEKAEYWPRLSGELARLAARPQTTEIEDRVEAIYQRFGFRLPRLAALAATYADSDTRQLNDAYTDTRTVLFQSQARLATYLAKKTFNRVYGTWKHPQWEEALAEAELSVITAIDRFDPALGVPLSAYARWWIRKGVSAVIHKAHMVHMPEKVHRLNPAYSLASRLFQHEHLREPTTEELTKLMRIRTSAAKTLLHFPRVVDLEEILTSEDESWEERFLTRAPERIEHDIWQNAHAVLKPREYQVLQGHIAEEKTFDELGAELGIGGEGTRYLYGVALKKLRESDVFAAYK